MSYSYKKYDKERMARACAIALPVSTKQSVELCRFIRNRTVKKAKELLNGVAQLKTPVPFRRYIMDLGHKKKIGPGSYPAKAAKEFLKLVEGVEANAQFKGLNTNNLVIIHIKADKSSKTWHFGRKRRRQMKRTSLELVVEEKKAPEEKKGKEKENKKDKGAKK